MLCDKHADRLTDKTDKMCDKHLTLNYYDLRKIICLRKSEVYVERISVCNVIENVEEHGIHCLPCSYTNDIGMLS